MPVRFAALPSRLIERDVYFEVLSPMYLLPQVQRTSSVGVLDLGFISCQVQVALHCTPPFSVHWL
jgi:hypothetical protein